MQQLRTTTRGIALYLMRLAPTIIKVTLVKYRMRLTWIGRLEHITHRSRSPGIALDFFKLVIVHVQDAARPGTVLAPPYLSDE